jgi:hypothetical protein
VANRSLLHHSKEKTDVPAFTAEPVADTRGAEREANRKARQQRLVLIEEEPYPRCEHWRFENACVACWYKKKYPQLCSAA